MNRRKSGETVGNSLKCGLCPKEKTFSTRAELRDHIAVKHLRIQQSGAMNWYVDHLLDSMEAALMDDDSTLIESLTLEEQCDTPSTRSRTTKTAKLISSASSSSSSDSESDVPVSPPKKKKTPEKPRSSSKSVLAPPPLPLPQTTVVCKLCKQSMSSDFLTRRCHVSEIHMRSGEAQSDDDYLEVLAGKVKKAFPDMEIYNEKQCELCFKECNSVTTRRSHVLSEHCPPPMVCPVNNCSHDFGEVAKAEKHIATNHGISHTAANIKSKWSEEKKRFNLQVSAQVERCFRVPLGNKRAPAVTSSRVLSDDVVVRDVRAAAAQEFRRPVRQIEASEEDDSDDDEEEGGVANEDGDRESEMEESTDERGPTGDVSIPIQQPQMATDDIREKVVKEEVVSPEKTAPVIQDRTVSSGGGKNPKEKEGVQQSVVKREPREEEESMVSVPLFTRKRRREESEQEETSQTVKRSKNGRETEGSRKSSRIVFTDHDEAKEEPIEQGEGEMGTGEWSHSVDDTPQNSSCMLCTECNVYVRKNKITLHIIDEHGLKKHMHCPVCRLELSSSDMGSRHIKSMHSTKTFKEFVNAFNDRIDEYKRRLFGGSVRDCQLCAEKLTLSQQQGHLLGHFEPSAITCCVCGYRCTILNFSCHVNAAHTSCTSVETLRLIDQEFALRNLRTKCFANFKATPLLDSIFSHITNGVNVNDMTREELDALLSRAGLSSAMRWDEQRKVLSRVEMPCRLVQRHLSNSRIVFTDEEDEGRGEEKEQPMEQCPEQEEGRSRSRSASVFSANSARAGEADADPFSGMNASCMNDSRQDADELVMMCKECQVTVPKNMLAHHLSRRHKCVSKCSLPQCGKICHNKQELVYHTKNVHGKGVSKTDVNAYDEMLDSAKRRFFGDTSKDCRLCGEELTSVSFSKHSHADKSALRCVICRSSHSMFDFYQHCRKTHRGWDFSEKQSLKLLDQAFSLHTLAVRCFPQLSVHSLQCPPFTYVVKQTTGLTRESLDKILAEHGLRSAMRWDEGRKILSREEVKVEEEQTRSLSAPPPPPPTALEKTTRQQQHIVFSDSEDEGDELQEEDDDQDMEHDAVDTDRKGTPVCFLLDGAPVIFDPNVLVDCATCGEKVRRQYACRRAHVLERHVDARTIPKEQLLPVGDKAMRAAFVDLPYAETQCELCGFGTTSMARKVEHVREHLDSSKERVSDACARISARTLFSGQREPDRMGVGSFIAGHVFTCSECGDKVHTRDTRDHLVAKHGIGWRCTASGCDHVLYATRGIVQHVQKSHPRMQIPNIAEMHTLDAHVNDCVRRFFNDMSLVCSLCGSAQSSFFGEHIRIHTVRDAMFCPLCPNYPNPLRSAHLFMKHVKEEHSSVSHSERLRLADACLWIRELHARCFPLSSHPHIPPFLTSLGDRRVQTRADVDEMLSESGEASALRWDEEKKMLIRNRNYRVKSESVDDTGGDEPVECSLCCAVFTPSTISPSSHVPSHANEDAFACPLCPRDKPPLKSIGKMLGHIRLHHLDTRRADALHLLDVYMGLRDLHVKCFPGLKPPSLPRIETIQEYDEQGEMTRKRLNELLSARLAKSVMNWDGNKKIMYRKKRKE